MNFKTSQKLFSRKPENFLRTALEILFDNLVLGIFRKILKNCI
jgi:hypothetical protein